MSNKVLMKGNEALAEAAIRNGCLHFFGYPITPQTELAEYKVQARGGQGTTTYKISEETGNVSGFGLVTDDDDIILMTSEGIIIRLNTEDISTLKRVTKGVRLMRLADGVKIVSAAPVAQEEEETEEVETVAENQISEESSAENTVESENAEN